MLAVHLIISAIVVYLGFRLTRWAIRKLKSPVDATQNSTLNLFISLGVTMLFFMQFVEETVQVFFRFLVYPFYNMRDIISASEQEIEFRLLRLLENEGNAIFYFLSDINYPKTIIFLSVWLLLAEIFSAIAKNIKRHENLAATVTSEVVDQNPVVRTIMTLGFLLFSVYLSISSIVAVGEFEPKGEVNYQLLSKDLEEALNNISYYKLDELKLKPLALTGKGMEDYKMKSVVEELNELVVDFNSFVEQQSQSDGNSKKTIIDRYSSAINTKMSLNDRTDYKSALIDWYSQQNTKWVNNTIFESALISGKIDRIASLQNDSTKLVNDTISFNPLKTKKKYNADISSELDDMLQSLPTLRYNFRYNLTEKNNKDPFPEKPKKGEKFGIFNLIAGWLLRTESTSLALIVGMFGFGLLGSIGSTFIRKRLIASGAEISDAIVTNDLLGIVINGISAAIVIFLSVKGAVLVFTAGTSDDLNAYVLFFTCLVASVYSENVWQWAKQKLSQNLGKEAEKPDETKIEKGKMEKK